MSINPKIFRQVRKALGLTQQELADAFGLSRVTVNKMEQGRLKRGIPDEIAARLMALRPKSSPVEMVTRSRHPMKPYGQADVNNDHDLWDNEEDES